ncbi:DUF1045 domain-containing protein [Candidatus Pacearchaeota archaeon]|nr:DUF1045 domain-containing protein [Candidatus Pacearchaeota archaeon]
MSFILNNFTIDYGTFLFWNSEKNDYLLKVQREFIDAINPLREGLIQPVLKTLTNVPEEERKNIERYGYPTVGDSFKPHITITRIKSPDDARQSLESLTEYPYSFEADRIVLAYLGAHGTVKKIISGFNLRN